MDSEVNNAPSLNDVKDYMHLNNLDTLRESAIETKSQRPLMSGKKRGDQNIGSDA